MNAEIFYPVDGDTDPLELDRHRLRDTQWVAISPFIRKMKKRVLSHNFLVNFPDNFNILPMVPELENKIKVNIRENKKYSSIYL